MSNQKYPFIFLSSLQNQLCQMKLSFIVFLVKFLEILFISVDITGLATKIYTETTLGKTLFIEIFYLKIPSSVAPVASSHYLL